MLFFFFFNDTATTEIYTLSLHDALPIYHRRLHRDHPRRDDVGDEGSRRAFNGRRGCLSHVHRRGGGALKAGPPRAPPPPPLREAGNPGRPAPPGDPPAPRPAGRRGPRASPRPPLAPP